MKVALFFMYRSFGGGTTSFTVHLYEGMRRAGFEPKIFRVKERGEEIERPFSKYEGVTYRNVTADEAKHIVKRVPSLMTAPCNSKFLPWAPDIIGQLMKLGMRVVIHDPNEFEIYDHLKNREEVVTPFCIRPSMKKFFPRAIWIPHPYVREYAATRPLNLVNNEREWLAVSVARVTFVKRTEIILEANEMLPKSERVVLRGAENRLYTRFKILPRFKNFKQGTVGFPMTWGASARECGRAKFAVDFTWFPDDGGGSQYSFMEAWDAGTVNILHNDWLRYKGEMVHNKTCIAVNNAEELALLLRKGREMDVSRLVQNGYLALLRHNPEDVAREYMQEMERCSTNKFHRSRCR